MLPKSFNVAIWRRFYPTHWRLLTNTARFRGADCLQNFCERRKQSSVLCSFWSFFLHKDIILPSSGNDPCITYVSLQCPPYFWQFAEGKLPSKEMWYEKPSISVKLFNNEAFLKSDVFKGFERKFHNESSNYKWVILTTRIVSLQEQNTFFGGLIPGRARIFEFRFFWRIRR